MTKTTYRRKGLFGLWAQKVRVHGGGNSMATGGRLVIWDGTQEPTAHISNRKHNAENANMEVKDLPAVTNFLQQGHTS